MPSYHVIQSPFSQKYRVHFRGRVPEVFVWPIGEVKFKVAGSLSENSRNSGVI